MRIGKLIYQEAMVFFILSLLFACGGSQTTLPEAAKTAEAINAIKPGTLATKPDGNMIKASLKGKEWNAASMIPAEASGRIIGYYEDDYIGLPYDKRDMVAGKKLALGPDNAIDVFVKDAPGGWLTTSGEIIITKSDDKWVEGTFSASMKSTGSNGSLELTNGSFRIPAAGGK